jgi:hypothetical protein
VILEIVDQGRIEKLAVVNGCASKDIDGRAYIGGYYLNTSGYGSVWFDKSVWNIEVLPKQDGIIAYRLTRKAD